MGKSKKGVSHAGPHKKHGPKKKLFHNYGNKVTRLNFGQAGVLDKYHCLESFILACQSRGLKSSTPEDWDARFRLFTQDLKTHKEQVEWLRNCKNYKEPEKKNKKAQ